MLPVLDSRIKAISGKGTYVLHIELKSTKQIVVGKLGSARFDAGHYAYVGRAFGTGGLAARLAHHLRLTASPHWHMDFLRPHGVVKEIWYGHTTPVCEHLWNRALMQIRGATVPVKGFGSSDCRCVAHLVRFSRRPRQATFRRQLLRLSLDAAPGIRNIQITSPENSATGPERVKP